MRHFIFFYKCTTDRTNQYGQQGFVSDELPSCLRVAEAIASSSDYSKNHVNIIGFNEVTKSDYINWFGIKTEANDSE